MAKIGLHLTSDASGKFTFSGLRRGTYQLTAEASHYRFAPVGLDLTATASALSQPMFFASQLVL
jgi:hypothetical protein